MANKQPRVFVVLARCNCDDVICGAYVGTRGLGTAKRRAKQIANRPELRFKNKAQANDTEFLHADVFQVAGAQVICVCEFHPPDDKRRKADAV